MTNPTGSYAISYGAFRCRRFSVVHGMNLIIDDARSEDEATGIGHRRALEDFPPGRGWAGHHVMVVEIEIDEDGEAPTP